MEQSLEASRPLLDMLPEPVFVLEGGALRYANPSAQPLLQNGALPSELEPIALRGGAGACSFFNRSFRAETALLPPYRLLRLRPEETECALDAQAVARMVQRMRYPMSAAVSAAQLLTDVLDDAARAQVENYLQVLNQSHYRLLRMVGNLSDLGRYTLPDFTPAPRPMDLEALVRETAQTAQPLAACAGSRLRCETEGRALPTRGDPDAIEQLLLHLLSNAMKYTPAGGEITVTLHRGGDTAYLSVTNDGAPTEELGQIFERYRTQLPLTDAAAGGGLGLALVQSIAAFHGGSVMLAPRAEGGVCVTVRLPLRTDGMTALRSAGRVDYRGGFSRALLALSDALPSKAFATQDVE